MFLVPWLQPGDRPRPHMRLRLRYLQGRDDGLPRLEFLSQLGQDMLALLQLGCSPKQLRWFAWMRSDLFVSLPLLIYRWPKMQPESR